MTAPLESRVYALRFNDRDLAAARKFWKPIAAYLQEYFPEAGTTLDLGAGYCHFINNIVSAQRIAVDVDEQTLFRCAAREVRKVVTTGADLSAVPSASVDTVFASNVYEHFPSREEVAASFREVWRVLQSDGRFVIMQPNFRYCKNQYYDFFDHRLAFTHRGMIEGLEITGFRMERVVPQFLPSTSKSRFPKAPWLVALYLRMPLAWRIFGGQMLLVARKTP